MFKKSILYLLVVLFSTSVFAQEKNMDVTLNKCFDEIKPFKVHYILKTSFLNVNSTNILTKKGNNWIYKNTADKGLVGHVIEESDFFINKGVFEFKKYYSYRRILINKKEQYVIALKNKKLYKSTKGNKSFAYKNKNKYIFDKASQQLAIQCLVKNNYKNFKLNLIDLDGVNTFEYKVGKKEKIKTPIGILNAIRVEQVRNDNREVHFWLSPKLDFLPVSFVYIEDGKVQVEAKLKSFKWLNKGWKK